jgi:hypothetical protein
VEDDPLRRIGGGHASDASAAASGVYDDYPETSRRTLKEQKDEELKVFWPYITNMYVIYLGRCIQNYPKANLCLNPTLLKGLFNAIEKFKNPGACRFKTEPSRF